MVEREVVVANEVGEAAICWMARQKKRRSCRLWCRALLLGDMGIVRGHIWFAVFILGIR